jgi:prophage DNA circulation protein
LTRTELNEAVSILQSTAANLSALTSGTTEEGAALDRACTTLKVDAKSLLLSGSIGSTALACFTAATTASITADQFYAIRSTISALAPSYSAGITMRQMLLRMCIAEESRAVSNAILTSRSEAEAILARMVDDLEAIEDFAADNIESSVYQAFLALHGAVAYDLSQRASQLPKLATYTFGKRRTALTLANVLYGDASRADEIINENSPVHPAFMPDSIRALTE